MSASSNTPTTYTVPQTEDFDTTVAMADVPKWVTVGEASALSGLTYYEVVSRANDARVASRRAMLIDTRDLAPEITTKRKASARALLTDLCGAEKVDQAMKSLGYDSEMVAS